MKRFLLKCLVWILALFLLEGVLYWTGFRFATFNGIEVMKALSKSKKKSGKKLLIIGDSVCNQVYPSDSEYPDAVSLACNQAVSMAGHYFLMNNYFQANAQSLPEKVVVVCSPMSLQNDLDKFAFQYFLKPFFNGRYKPMFNEALWNRVELIPHYRVAALPFIRISNYAFEYSMEPEQGYDLVSPLSRSYMERMEQLAASHGVQFSLLCAPLRMTKKEEVIHAVENSMSANELDDALLNSYEQSLSFFPDSLFVDDNHFIKNSIPADPCCLFTQP